MITLQFKNSPIRSTQKACCYQVSDQRTVWIPAAFLVGNVATVPDDFKFTVTWGIMRQSFVFIGVELAEEYSDVVEVIE